MPKSLYVSFTGQTTTANTTQYWWINGRNVVAATEDRLQQIIRTPGVFSKGFVRVSANTVAATSTFKARKNAADGNISIPVGSNATGTFEDTVNTDTVASADKYTLSSVPGAATGTITVQLVSIIFEQNVNGTDTVTRIGCASAATISTASTTFFCGLSGSLQFQTAEADAKVRIRKAIVAKNLCFRVTTQRPEAITVKSRKNGADGNMSMTIGSGATGFIEDTTNSDTLAAGDDYNLTLTTGGAAGNLIIQNTQLDFVASSPSESMLIAQAAAGSTQTQNVTYRWGLCGPITTNATELNAQIITREAWEFSQLTIHASANTVNADSFFTFRKNGADGNQSQTIGPLATGYFTDTTHSDITTSSDLICTQLVVGATGAATMTVRSASVSARPIKNQTLTITETETIGESKTRAKAAWRLQP